MEAKNYGISYAFSHLSLNTIIPLRSYEGDSNSHILRHVYSVFNSIDTLADIHTHKSIIESSYRSQLPAHPTFSESIFRCFGNKKRTRNLEL